MNNPQLPKGIERSSAVIPQPPNSAYPPSPKITRTISLCRNLQI